MLEVEDKFRVQDDFEVPVLHGDGGPVALVSRPRQQTLEAVYYDTDDLRLARAGVTVRHRSGEGPGDDWHLKLPVAGARAGAREELHEGGPSGEVPLRFRVLLTAYVRHGDLRERATLRTDRVVVDLMAADGNVLAQLVDDRVDAVTSDHTAARFREVEVEDRAGGPVVLDHVGDLLRAAGAVSGHAEPKLVTALGAAATEPPSPPPPMRVSKGDPARDLVAATFRVHVQGLLGHDPWARLGADDAVHQMRVSARRLRSALRDFTDLVDPEWGSWAQDELRWLGGALAVSRNTEVLRERFQRAIGCLDPELSIDPAGRRLFAMLDADAERGRCLMEGALNSDRYATLLDALVDAATRPKTTDTADRPCSAVAPAIVEASWRRLAKRARRARRPGGTGEQYHRARISAKRTRYLAEAMVPVFGKQAKRFATQVESVQEILGEHQDTVVAREALRRASAEPRLGRAAFTFGVLHGREEQAAERARKAFDEAWPQVAKRRHRRWLAG